MRKLISVIFGAFLLAPAIGYAHDGADCHDSDTTTQMDNSDQNQNSDEMRQPANKQVNEEQSDDQDDARHRLFQTRPWAKY